MDGAHEIFWLLSGVVGHFYACVRDSPNGTIGNFTNRKFYQWYNW